MIELFVFSIEISLGLLIDWFEHNNNSSKRLTHRHTQTQRHTFRQSDILTYTHTHSHRYTHTYTHIVTRRFIPNFGLRVRVPHTPLKCVCGIDMMMRELGRYAGYGCRVSGDIWWHYVDQRCYTLPSQDIHEISWCCYTHFFIRNQFTRNLAVSSQNFLLLKVS